MFRTNRARWVAVPLLVAVIGWLWVSNFSKMWSIATLPNPQEAVQALRAERKRLDETVWAGEVLAQQYEQYFIKLWDDLRASEDKSTLLSQVDFDELVLGRESETKECGDGIRLTSLVAGGASLTPDSWKEFLGHIKNAGYRLAQCEFHHNSFDFSDRVARSRIGTVLHVVGKDDTDRIDLSGELEVTWSSRKNSDGHFVPRRIDAREFTMLRRSGPPAFQPAFNTEGVAIEGPANWEDVLVMDLDRDNLSDFVHVTTNRVYWNRGQFSFQAEELCTHPVADVIGSVLADFTSDGVADLLVARRTKKSDSNKAIMLFPGDREGRFSQAPIASLKEPLELRAPDSCAVGDANGDGNLDVWLTQYKMPYRGGQMPTPYYDANDGWPSYLLLGDGAGRFVDATEAAGLATKRFRRTYRSSLVDLDDDGDLDLIVVSDFAGLDVHLNDGQGSYSDVTTSIVDEPSNFGMSHTLADFNSDGKLDLYVTGMASTTARRLDQLGLGREGFDDYQKMRSVIAYGNRMYLRTESGEFAQPEFRDQVARCGWSWGCASLDFDNDGDVDICVANGHNSGDSAKDYCTKFWRHDIYTGDSREQPILDLMFMEDLMSGYYTNEGGLRQRESWNGYEHNRLLMNQSGEGFLNVAHLMGVALETDSRHLVVDDFDLDGRPDLLVGWLDRSHGPTKLVFSVLKNNWPEENNWIGFRLRGAPEVSPLGAKVTVAYEGGEQVAVVTAGDSFASQHSHLKHFGLGKRDSVEFVSVRWPDGTKTRMDRPKINRYHSLNAHD